MFILYLLQYIDKTSLGYTAIMGIIEDTVSNLLATILYCHTDKSKHLVGTQYSWISSFFYVGFLVASPLAATALVKFPVGKVVIVSVYGLPF